MINLQCPVNRGKMVNQDGQFAIREMIVRGGETVALKATSKESGEELSGGIELDLLSLTNYLMIPLDSLLTGSVGGRADSLDIRF